MTNRSSTFTLSAPSAKQAADARGMIRSLHPTLSYSQLMELLVWHWMKSPPPAQEVLQFKFKTKLGRPRASS